MSNFVNGQNLLTAPEIKRYVLKNNFSGQEHLATEEQLRAAFKNKYDKITSNRDSAWTVYEYFE
ncbi:hypothetical protein CPT_Merlin55 [Citrobacter phage Merlin]|uniref:Uncharacterized protein n=1 Tax=Citrobacter phage Merlin TaxID=1675602 RepID=A0A0K1LMF9_9CAUD|nr:hypothetical protein CPT_Merlin55 [Citrobacter phage Merlin]AKU43701.1 hypothetical protein CPT_Merlin55 [Citrobacter phage Merlin]